MLVCGRSLQCGFEKRVIWPAEGRKDQRRLWKVKKNEVANTLCSLEILRRKGVRERVACDQGNLSDNNEDKSRLEKREWKLREEKEWKEWI